MTSCRAPQDAAPQSLLSLPLPPLLGSPEGPPRRQSLSLTPLAPSPSTTAPSHVLHLRSVLGKGLGLALPSGRGRGGGPDLFWVPGCWVASGSGGVPSWEVGPDPRREGPVDPSLWTASSGVACSALQCLPGGPALGSASPAPLGLREALES